MRITVTTDAGEVIDVIDVAEEIGELTKPLPQAELIARLIQDAKKALLREVMEGK